MCSVVSRCQDCVSRSGPARPGAPFPTPPKPSIPDVGLGAVDCAPDLGVRPAECRCLGSFRDMGLSGGADRDRRVLRLGRDPRTGHPVARRFPCARRGPGYGGAFRRWHDDRGLHASRPGFRHELHVALRRRDRVDGRWTMACRGRPREPPARRRDRREQLLGGRRLFHDAAADGGDTGADRNRRSAWRRPLCGAVVGLGRTAISAPSAPQRGRTRARARRRWRRGAGRRAGHGGQRVRDRRRWGRLWGCCCRCRSASCRDCCRSTCRRRCAPEVSEPFLQRQCCDADRRDARGGFRALFLLSGSGVVVGFWVMCLGSVRQGLEAELREFLHTAVDGDAERRRRSPQSRASTP